MVTVNVQQVVHFCMYTGGSLLVLRELISYGMNGRICSYSVYGVSYAVY